MRVLFTATAVLALDRATVNSSTAFQILAPSSGPGRIPASLPRRALSSVGRPSPWAVSSTRRRAAPTAPLRCVSASQTSDVAAKPDSRQSEKAAGSGVGGGGHGHGHGGGGGAKAKAKVKSNRNSFVQWDMRRAAMKLHTRDQAPKEGQQENKGTRFSDWKPKRRGYLQFLVDSKVVYEALEEACEADDRLSEFRDTGLERTGALTKDIAWMLETYPDATEGGDKKAPPPTENALEYASYLREIRESSLPGFMCHFYNHYFAHTAGGRMIGRKVAESCFEGRTLEFYTWEAGDVKELLDGVRVKIDEMAKGWTPEEKEACVEETGRTFHYGGRLLSSVTA